MFEERDEDLDYKIMIENMTDAQHAKYMEDPFKFLFGVPLISKKEEKGE